MSILIKGMKMPTTGLYFVSVDNTGGKDKTVVTVERMLGNSDVRQIIGSFELAPVPPHGDLIGRNPLIDIAMHLRNRAKDEYTKRVIGSVIRYIAEAPTIIPAEADKEQREYEAAVEAAQYCEMCEPSCDPETGAL